MKRKSSVPLRRVGVCLTVSEADVAIQWTNSTVLAKLKTKKEACQRYLQTRSDADYNLYARARNQAKESCRTAVKTIEKNIAKNAKKNPKAFFLNASSKCKIKDGISD
jgi:hypothetical protein